MVNCGILDCKAKVSEKDKSTGKSSTNPVGFVKTPKTQFNRKKQNVQLIKKIIFQVCIRFSVNIEYIKYNQIHLKGKKTCLIAIRLWIK